MFISLSSFVVRRGRSARYRAVIAALCLVLCSSLPISFGISFAQDGLKEVGQRYEKAMLLAEESKYSDAVEELDKVLKMAPDFKLAETYRKVFEKRAEASEMFRELGEEIDKNPKRAKAYYDMGLLNMEVDEYKKAFALLQKARELDDKSQAIREGMSLAFEKGRMWSTHIKSLREEAVAKGYLSAEVKVAEEKEEPRLSVERARLREDRELLKKESQRGEAALQKEKTSPSLGEMELIEKKEREWRIKSDLRRSNVLREKEKIEELIAAQTTDKPDSYLLLYYGICLDKLGNYQKAALQFKKGMEAAGNFKMAEEWAKIALEREAVAQRIGEAEGAIENRPSDQSIEELARGHYNLGKLLMEVGDYDSALTEFSLAYEIGRKSGMYKEELAEAYRKKQSRDDYIKQFREEALARGYITRELEDGGEEERRRIEAKQNQWIAAQKRRRESALDEIEEIKERMEKRPDMLPYLLVQYGLSLDRAGEYGEAVRQIKAATEKIPNFKWAEAWLEVARKKEAAVDRIRAAEEDILNCPIGEGSARIGATHAKLGKLLMEAGDYDRAFDEMLYAYELNKELKNFKRMMQEAYAKKILWKKYLRDHTEKDRALARIANVWGTPGTKIYRLEKDRQIMFSLKPNMDFSWEANLLDGVEYKTNSLGLRNEEITVPKPPGVYRILCIGDSITFGDKVALEKTFPKALENILNENRGKSDAQKFEVINAGIRSYSTYNELGYFKKRGVLLDPDMVIVGFCYNDVENPHFLFDERTLEVFGEIPKEAIPNLELLTVWDELSLTKKVSKRRAIRRRLQERDGESLVRALWNFSSPEWVWLRKQLDGILRVASRRKMKMAVVMFPLKWQLKLEEDNCRSFELMEKYCKSRGIIMIDLLSLYHKEGADNIFVFKEDDVHPSELGHLIAAEEIFRKIAPVVLPAEGT